MFIDDYNKMSRSDRDLFSEAVNDLLYQCFIVRKSYDRKGKMFRADPDYFFIERHYSTFEDYLSYMDMQLSKNDEDGVIFLTSGAERNHLRIDSVTTLMVYALRSYYEGAISKAPEETEVMMTSGALNSLVQEMGLSNLSKRLSSSTIASSLRTLDSFNVVSRANGTYGDPSYSFFIMPTIRYVISSEKMNTLYTFLTKGPETEESPNLFDMEQKPNDETEEESHAGFASALKKASIEESDTPNRTVDIPVNPDIDTAAKDTDNTATNDIPVSNEGAGDDEGTDNKEGGNN